MLLATFATMVFTVLWLWFTVVMLMRLLFFDVFSLIGLPVLAVAYAAIMLKLWRWANYRPAPSQVTDRFSE